MLYWPEIWVPNRFTGDFGFPKQETEYVVIDWQRKQPYLDLDRCWEDEIIDELQDKYKIVEERDGVTLYKLKGR